MQHLPVTVSSPPSHRAADAQANSPFAKHLRDQVRHAPYKATLASAFVLGCALLQSYLMWIDHVPSDLLALLGLATLVSAWLAALWAFATLMMFATVFAVMLYNVEPPRPLIAFVGQAAGACGVLGFLLVKL
ncbi:MAG: hypothetical protein EOO27_31615 [Comamonadaceae bacterium]|nr:MAG: hypothetical protein EOO27_31615 [Comamonadaceae bacterium]